MPSRTASRSSMLRSGPSPYMARLAVGTALLTMCHALSSIAKSFSGVRRPREMIVWLEAPGLLGLPEAPEVPEVPEVPEEPEEPEEPDNPDNPEEPEEPEIPDDKLLISE